MTTHFLLKIDTMGSLDENRPSTARVEGSNLLKDFLDQCHNELSVIKSISLKTHTQSNLKAISGVIKGKKKLKTSMSNSEDALLNACPPAS